MENIETENIETVIRNLDALGDDPARQDEFLARFGEKKLMQLGGELQARLFRFKGVPNPHAALVYRRFPPVGGC